MIIDACERFTRNPGKKINSAAPYTESASVVRLTRMLRTTFEKDAATKQIFDNSPAAADRYYSRNLRETFGAMVFSSNDITAAFYKRLANPRWWDKPHFKSLAAADSSDLMTALMGMAYDPPRPAAMQRFLQESKLKFHDQHRGSLDNRIMAVNLVAAINEVNRNQWSEPTRVAWQNALHPDNIYSDTTSDQHDHG